VRQYLLGQFRTIQWDNYFAIHLSVKRDA